MENEELDKIENQETEEFDNDDFEESLDQDRMFSLTDEELEKEMLAERIESSKSQKAEVGKEPEIDKVDDESESEELSEEDESGEVGSETEPSSVKTEKFKVKANGMEFDFTQEELIQLAPKAMDYTKKLQQLAPYRKSISAMEDNGITEQDINMLIEIKKGNKDALASIMKDSKIDPVDVMDIESDGKFIPPSYGKNESQLEVQEVYQRIHRDETYKFTEQIVDREWDSASRKTLMEKPDMIEGLHADIKNGIYAKVAPEAEKLRVLDGGRKSNLDYYIQAGEAIFNQKVNPNEQKINTEIDRQSQQSNINDAANKRKAAALPKANTSSRKVVDYLDESDEAYEDWYKKLQSKN